ncbi:hypothetical protein CIG75_03600 [Tumebacillus algifaecis]|uniref:DUF2785 domain-containing protein n=1 Tax=Tumebacillus algifaecis TaxID=1214604 RepID=A0A223CXX2_9BACL|nr:DUF2785 domain-containing protein [Tumebacillus algifaecis]ASS74161.1 hypothetical protein CIG75_03600 [Tumebacillus algifaecis]
MNLLQELEIIKQNEYQLAEYQDLMSLTNSILDHLGSADSYLRDDLGYLTLSNWIYQKDLFSAEQLGEILSRVVSDEMWFYKIGETGTDSVFLRSFSSLVIALLLLRDNKNPFITPDEFRMILSRMVDYCQQERDLRGFVAHGGWAHAAAHVADAVDECVKHRYATAADCEQLWGALQALIRHAKAVYEAEEDERINNALFAMIETGKVSLEQVCAWLEAEEYEGSDYNESFTLRINWKHLIRSLYFRLKDNNLLGDSEESLLVIQRRFAPPY